MRNRRPPTRRNFAKLFFLFLLLFFGNVLRAADGSGTNTVVPLSIDPSATDQTFTFTFTAAETMDSGEVSIKVPVSRGWSAPQGSSGQEGYTTVTASGNGTVATVLTNADSTAGWAKDDSDACNVSPPTGGFGLSGSILKEGSGSITCNNIGSTAPNNKDSFGYDFSEQNWSLYTEVGFWIRSSTAISSSDINVAIDDSPSCSSPIEELHIPALEANTWMYVKWTFSRAGSTRSSVNTFCLNAGNEGGLDSKQIWVDEVLVGSGFPTFRANGSDTDIHVRFVDLAAGETVTVIYGNGGGANGVDVPASGSLDEFTTRTRISAGGNLTNIGSHPTVNVGGILSVDIVDANGNPVGSPSLAFSSQNYSFGSQTSTATLGSASQKIRMKNTTSTATWTLSIAATAGPSALWNTGISTYDYNHPSGGRLTIDPSGGTLAAVSPCSSTADVTKGSAKSFSEVVPVVSSITLLSAGASAATNCSWDFTGVSLSQIIPASQAAGTYTISFTLTVA